MMRRKETITNEAAYSAGAIEDKRYPAEIAFANMAALLIEVLCDIRDLVDERSLTISGEDQPL